MIATLHNYFLNKPLFLDNPHGWIQHIPFAFYLVEIMKPDVIVELGTYSGNSYFSFCQAVKDLHLQTRCVAVDTWQGDLHVGKYGKEVYERVKEINEQEFSAFSQLMQMPFDKALPHFPDNSIDLLHIDGTHTYEAVQHDFHSWLPKLSRGGVILLHDTVVKREGFGVRKFLKEIKTQYTVFELHFSEGLAVVCTDDHTHSGIVNFIKRAKQAPSLIKFFEALGKNILLEREKNLFRDEVLLMRKKTAVLNKQLREKQREIKRLKKDLAEK